MTKASNGSEGQFWWWALQFQKENFLIGFGSRNLLHQPFCDSAQNVLFLFDPCMEGKVILRSSGGSSISLRVRPANCQSGWKLHGSDLAENRTVGSPWLVFHENGPYLVIWAFKKPKK